MSNDKKPKKKLILPLAKKVPNAPKGDPKPNDALSSDVREAVKVGEETLRIIEEDVPDRAKENNIGFFEGVEAKTKGILDSIVRTNRVSEAQANALDNMQSAVKKWVHNDRDD
jgi:hypothetical protein